MVEWWTFDAPFLRVAVIVLVVLVIACLLLVALLLTLRIGFDLKHRRDEARATALRATLFDLVMGEPREATEAERTLLAMGTRQWEFARRQAVSMLPKLRGESRDQLIRLLRDKGSVAKAMQQVHSASMVRRCRGAFTLGVLQEHQHVDVLIRLLDDPAFLVRRVAVRALGNLGAAAAVPALLHVGDEEPRLSRDLIYALHRIGPEGIPAMRARLAEVIEADSGARSAELVVAVLGALGDFQSRQLITDGLRSERAALAAASADALGAICAPDTEAALVVALTHPAVRVRAAAAKALGSMASTGAVEPLARLVEESDHSASREAAAALLGLGEPGRRRLAESASPFAVEALALADLRRRR